MRISDWSSDVCSSDLLEEMIGYFAERIAEHRAIPEGERPDDLLTLLIESEVEGEPIEDMHLLGTCFLLLVAGIDTTWSSIGSGLWHLATHPEDQQRLRDEPELMDTAVEEILRMYSPVTMARYVTEARSEEHTSALQSLMRISY